MNIILPQYTRRVKTVYALYYVICTIGLFALAEKRTNLLQEGTILQRMAYGAVLWLDVALKHKIADLWKVAMKLLDRPWEVS